MVHTGNYYTCICKDHIHSHCVHGTRSGLPLVLVLNARVWIKIH